MTQTELLHLRKTFVPRGPFNVTPYFAKQAIGASIFDSEGGELIDFAGGIGTMNVGPQPPAGCCGNKRNRLNYSRTPVFIS